MSFRFPGPKAEVNKFEAPFYVFAFHVSLYAFKILKSPKETSGKALGNMNVESERLIAEACDYKK